MRVLLADREGTARRALADLLRSISGVALVGVAGTREQVTDAMRRTRPDVLVIDDRLLARSDGHGLGGHDPGVRVIVIGVDDEPAFAARAHRLGAEAWIAKDRADDELPGLLGHP